MSARVKMNCLTQEVIRRLRNTRASLDWDEYKVPILTEFCKKMARSGYPEGYRAEVIKSGVIGFERQLEASQRGERPLFRSKDWQKEERRKRKLVRKVSWYRPADCVGFYPPSPRGELVTEINKVLDEEGRRIGIKMRAIETGGLSLAKQLVKPRRALWKAGLCFGPDKRWSRWATQHTISSLQRRLQIVRSCRRIWRILGREWILRMPPMWCSRDRSGRQERHQCLCQAPGTAPPRPPG